MQTSIPGPALVISLDFELHWGVTERVYSLDHPYTAHLLGAREVVPRLLELFHKRGVHATWATVGKLYGRDRDDLQIYKPEKRPAYKNPSVDTYQLPLGDSEEDDPLHFAPSLIEKIHATPGQELACHTFAHYYCDEPGQDADAFRADLEAAKRIAARDGVEHRSLVFPRNQVATDYLPVVEDVGLDVYRGNPPHRLYQQLPQNALLRHSSRALRLADSFLNLTGHHLISWSELNDGRLANIRASRFLRPYSNKLIALEPLRRHRVKSGLRTAARRGDIFHLWWHPHNFGCNLDENLQALGDILDEFERLRDQHGMQSMNMAEAADAGRS